MAVQPVVLSRLELELELELEFGLLTRKKKRKEKEKKKKQLFKSNLNHLLRAIPQEHKKQKPLDRDNDI